MLGEWAYGEGKVSVKLLIGRWTHMLEDEAVLQNHGQMKDAPNWRKALAVDHQLLRLLSDGYVQLGYLHGHALALQHLNGLHLLACPQAPAQQVNICSAFSLQRHIHSMALNAASVQASWLSSDKVDHVMWHQESDGAVHGMDKVACVGCTAGRTTHRLEVRTSLVAPRPASQTASARPKPPTPPEMMYTRSPRAVKGSRIAISGTGSVLTSSCVQRS